MKTKSKKSSAGPRGETVRSDCYVELELKESGGIKLNLQSKVETMYGESIRELIFDMCKFFSLKNAKVNVEDYGALPFTIAARFETAIKRALPRIKKEYLLPFSKKSTYKTIKDRLRRSRLYLPGNEPKYFINAGLHKPDGIILDLEDSVAPTQKDAAQLHVRNALRSVDFYGSERMVRINQLPKGLDDLKFIVPHNTNLLRLNSKSKERIFYTFLPGISDCVSRAAFRLTSVTTTRAPSLANSWHVARPMPLPPPATPFSSLWWYRCSLGIRCFRHPSLLVPLLLTSFPKSLYSTNIIPTLPAWLHPCTSSRYCPTRPPLDFILLIYTLQTSS